MKNDRLDIDSFSHLLIMIADNALEPARIADIMLDNLAIHSVNFQRDFTFRDAYYRVST